MVKQQSWRILSVFLLFMGLGLLALPQPGWGGAGFDSNTFTSFYFIHATDPHLNDDGKITQFKWLAAQANQLQVPFVLVGGDLSNYYLPGDWSGYDGCVSSFQMPLKPIPGNHDIHTTETLALWLQHFGKDYYSFVYNNCAFVCIDSETLNTPTLFPAEAQAQWTWLAKTLGDAGAAGRTQTFILTHRPPYDFVEDEGEGYSNMSPDVREQLLTLARDNGVNAIFAGHLHHTYAYPSVHPPLYILGGTAYTINDLLGIGYNLCRVTKSGLDVIYVRIDGPPDITPPGIPQPLTFASRTSSTVTLVWPRPGDDVGVLRYQVFRDGAPLAYTLDESYTDSGLAQGESHVYSVKAFDVAGNASGLSNPVLALAGVNGAQDIIMPAIPWRYLDGGAALGPLWVLPQFDDSRWRIGTTKIGFGLGDLTTQIDLNLNPPDSGAAEDGSDPLPSPPLTAYFRRTFTLDQDPAMLPLLTLKVLCMDGAVVYLNGFEVGRWNMPEGPIDATTPALGAVPPALANAWHELPLPFTLFRGGANTLAVEVHLASPASPAMDFDMQVMYSTVTQPVALTRGPYLADDTTTAVTVRWRTDLPAPSRAVWKSDPDGATTGLVTDLAPVTEHELRLAPLDPNSIYYYGIYASDDVLAGGDGQTSFKTNPPTGLDYPTRIWVLGDSGTGDANATAVRNAYTRFAGKHPADMWLMLGDNAYPAGSDADFQAKLFNIYPDMLRQACLWPTIGNHDAYTWLPGGAGHPYYADFTMPTQGEAGGVPSGSEAYYSFDYANIHCICLDSMESDLTTSGSMLTWLKKDLATVQSRWLIAYWHHPPYSKGAHDSDSPDNEGWKQIAMRQNALPILEAAGVDLVLCGHSHSYERSYLINGHYGDSTQLQPEMILDHGDGRVGGSGPYMKPMVRTPNSGTVYVVAGSSGQYTGPLGHHPVMCTWLPAETVGYLQSMGSLVIDVGGPRLDAHFIDSTGAIQDSFTIEKRLPQKNAVRQWGTYR